MRQVSFSLLRRIVLCFSSVGVNKTIETTNAVSSNRRTSKKTNVYNDLTRFKGNNNNDCLKSYYITSRGISPFPQHRNIY